MPFFESFFRQIRNHNNPLLMELLFILIAALLPVVILLGYVYKKDSVNPEPTGLLMKAFFYGTLSTLLSFCFSFPLSEIAGSEVEDDQYLSFFDAFYDAFCSAAIPEELAKFIMLWMLLKKNPFFNEKFDGIVYAVFVGLGFAGLENILYLLDNEDWVSVGITRAMFSIPGHMLFGVLMGYYYSIYHFGENRNLKTMSLILLAPITAHGLYDGILFSMNVSEELSAILMLVFIFFCYKLMKKGKSRIEELQGQ